MNLFRKMAGVIERRGLAKGSYIKVDGSVCMLGALYDAETEDRLFDYGRSISDWVEAYPLRDLCGRLGLASHSDTDPWSLIAWWSDTSSQAIVVAKLLATAEYEERTEREALEALDFESKVPEPERELAREITPAELVPA